jgi:putative adhesin
MRAFDSPGPIIAAIDMGGGIVRINASDRTDTVVEVRPGNELDDADVRVAEQTLVEYSGGRLLVKAPKRGKARWWLPGWGPSIAVSVGLPADSKIEVGTPAADVRCEGRFDEVVVDNAYGNTYLDEVATRLRLHSAYGGIRVSRAAGHCDIVTSGGEVRVDEIDGTAVVKNAHAGITVGQVTGDLRLTTSSGEIAVDRVLGQKVTAKTAYGTVWIGELVRGAVTAESSYGQLEIGIADGTAAWLDVSTQHGHLDSSLEPADGLPESDETAEVRARTTYGHIIIRRS